MHRKLIGLLCCMALMSCTSYGEKPAHSEDPPSDTLSALERAKELPLDGNALRSLFPFWYEPAEPLRVIGPIHFVGSQGLAMFFIPTDEGHILVDGGVPENAAMIVQSIRALGYDPEDIRILLNTHAHIDHSGGLAELKALSGAKLIASEGDQSALEAGVVIGSEDREEFAFPPVKVDQLIADGEKVRLGDITLTAHITPGHTRGCTSWTLQVTEEGRAYDALIFCSASVSLNRLVGPPQYEGIVNDYRSTFAVTKAWRPDVFLANHPEFYDHDKKVAKLKAGNPLAFVDQEGFPAFIRRMEVDFEKALADQSN